MSTVTTPPLDLRELVRTEDLPLETLSDDEYAALWADELVEVDPASAPVVGAALRGLVARQLATTLPDGRTELGEIASLVRAARHRHLALATIRMPLGHEHTERRWYLVERDVVLEQGWRSPGVQDFVLRSLDRAVRALVGELVPAGPRAEVARWSWSADDPDQVARLADLALVHPSVSHVSVERAVETGGDWVAITALLLTGGDHPDAGPGWIALEGPSSTAEVQPLDRALGREVLTEMMVGALAPVGTDAPTVPGQEPVADGSGR